MTKTQALLVSGSILLTIEYCMFALVYDFMRLKGGTIIIFTGIISLIIFILNVKC